MPKVLLVADPHIHAHKHSAERLQDCLKALEWVFSTAVEQGIEDIIFLGDLFHERQKIDVLTYQRVFEIFETNHTGKLRSHLLLGNHDLWHHDKWDISSVFPLRNIPGVQVIDRPCTLDIAGHPISFLPYTHDPVADLLKTGNTAKYKILCGHVAIDGAVWNVMHGIRAEVSVEHDGDMTIVDAGVFHGWNRVFLGHYHAAQNLNPFVEYVGSPLQLSFGEAHQVKHICIFDLDTKERHYVRNTFSPQHLIIHQAELPNHKLEGNFLRLLVDDLKTTDVVDLRHSLLTENKLGSLEINQADQSTTKDDALVSDAKVILLKEAEMLKHYVEVQENAGTLGQLDKEFLLRVGSRICITEEN